MKPDIEPSIFYDPPTYTLWVYVYVSPEHPLSHRYRVSPYAILAQCECDERQNDVPLWTRWPLKSVHECRKPRGEVADLFMSLALNYPNLSQVHCGTLLITACN